MNATLSLLVPLAVGFHPGPATPACGAGCAPRLPGPVAAAPVPTPFIGQPCPPDRQPAALLATTIHAPDGVKVTFSPGTDPRSFAAPVSAGLRPGYIYRFALSDLPGHPGETLYPVVEVRGSLAGRPAMNPADYPVPIVIRQGDIERAFRGVVVTKVYYLEDPTKADPVEMTPGEPLEYGHDTEDEALRAARDHGRIVAILRIGDRQPEAGEIARGSVPGTVLLPGDARLSSPPVPPWVPVAVYDPILGPRPLPEECFTDGGDKGPRLGIGPGGVLGGLNPTDVAVEYTQGAVRRVTTSNEVCICVPRFPARTVEVGIGRIDTARELEAADQVVGSTSSQSAIPAQDVTARSKPVGFDGSVVLAQQVGRQWASDVHADIQVAATGTARGLAVVASVVELDEITSFPNQLVVSKSIDPPGPHHLGQEITITIRYRNNTRMPLTDLVVSDSLSGRLQYVQGSASSDRPANVTETPNEVGSVVVRFELPGALAPGQGGEVKFRAKIR